MTESFDDPSQGRQAQRLATALNTSCQLSAQVKQLQTREENSLHVIQPQDTIARSLSIGNMRKGLEWIAY